MKPDEAVKLIMLGASTRKKSIPGEILDLLLNFAYEMPGIRHPLFAEIGRPGRKHLDNGGLILMMGDPGTGKTVTACCLGLLTAKTEKVALRMEVGYRPSSAEWEFVETKETEFGDKYELWNLTSQRQPQFSYWSTQNYLDFCLQKKKGAYDPKDVDHMFILDDFGHEHVVKDKYHDKRLSETILHRITYNKPTIIISNKTEKYIRDNYSEHIVSRLLGEKTMRTNWWGKPDMRR